MRPSVVLIGFQEQGNLGIGYVAAVLIREGYAVRILDFRQSRQSILDAVKETNPLLVGFSLIFQYYTVEFHSLAAFLRENGVTCHFTSGGHYPSICFEEALHKIPELDSVVRFEGELTTLELIQCLEQEQDWRRIDGIAYRDKDRCVATPVRALIDDLDSLPDPIRPMESHLTILGKRATPLAASRGCSRDCSFCSIRQFYSEAPGRKVRVRKPLSVAQEMNRLHESTGASIFLFQDDDFPVWGSFGRNWIQQFITSLRETGLYGHVLWKVNCRADEVEPELFGQMRDAGLYMVYLGIESGNEEGLKTLNKRLSPADSIRAVQTIRSLGLAFAYGFMLFDPSSTFASIRRNVEFLRHLTADGDVPVTFCRMLPYAGTPIEARLKAENRFRGDALDPGYEFLDPRISELFEALSPMTAAWFQGPDSVANQVYFAWQELWVLKRAFKTIELDAYERLLRFTTSAYNETVLRITQELIDQHELSDGWSMVDGTACDELSVLAAGLVRERDNFILLNQQLLLQQLTAIA
jgi:radical SAM superfamily enzyme YgiQ (UPF0313 family)